jgi:hypothetical protein
VACAFVVAACGDAFETGTAAGAGGATSSSTSTTASAGGSGGGGSGPTCGNGVVDAGELCIGEPASYPTTKAEAHDLALADCDGDGDQDVIVVHHTGAALVALHNDGSGVLGEASVASGVAGLPVAVALGELAGPAGVDAAIVYGDQSYVDLYTGAGDCTFGSVSAITWPMMQTGWLEAAVGNLAGMNGDDLVVTGAQIGVRPYGQSGTAISGFTPQSTAIATGDLDGDTIDDVAYTDAAGDRVLWKLGTGSGAGLPVSTPESVELATTPVTLAIDDIDGDGDADVVTANDDHTVSVLRNEGGSFNVLVPDVSVQGGDVNARAPRAIALADVDADGDLDVVTANADDVPRESSVTVLLNDGNGKLTLAPSFPRRVTRRPFGLGVADMNGDGALDIVTASAFVEGETSRVDVLLADP